MAPGPLGVPSPIDKDHIPSALWVLKGHHLAFLGSPSSPAVSHFPDLGLHLEVLDLLPLGNTKPYLATVSPDSAPTS